MVPRSRPIAAPTAANPSHRASPRLLDRSRRRLLRQTGPTRTVVAGGRPAALDSAVVHALKNVVTSIDETECGWVVDGVVEHLRLHTAQHFSTRPIGYQFQLSNGALVTVSDQDFGKRRALDFTADKVVEGWAQPLTMLVWPKALPDDGAGSPGRWTARPASG